MMKKNIISLLILAMVASVTFTSCEDMLTPDMDRHDEVDQIAKDTLYSYWGILKGLQDIAERYVILGECRGDNMVGTQYVSDSIHAILTFGSDGDASDGACRYLKASDFYHVINSCNVYMQQCDTLRTTGTNKSIMLKEYAQVASIRAWVYMQLVLTYGTVPYFDTPILSTAEIDNFWNNANTTVDANSLAQSNVVKKLEEVRNVEYPNYGHYGRVSTVADASQCIFPQNLVLADIYLLQASGTQSEADYRKAAQRYYDFLNTNFGGVINPQEYFTTQLRSRLTEEMISSSYAWLSMFSSKAAVRSTNEVVTVIPSSNNKLWGTVFRGINDLCGFTTDIAVATVGNDTTSSTVTAVSLTMNYEHELNPAPGLKRLSMAQNYEKYIGKEGQEVLTVINGAGDARYKVAVENYTNTAKGDDTPTEFIVKQQGNGGFSTTYPVIYRKGNIWLRFAEALNGAGFPGYAFAILKNGLCGNGRWVPNTEEQYEPAALKYYDPTETTVDDAGQRDTTFYDNSDLTGFFYRIYLQAYAANSITATTDSITKETFSKYFRISEPEYGHYRFIYNENEDPEMMMALFNEIFSFYTSNKVVYGTVVTSYSELPDESRDVVCNYIAKREMLASKAAPFLNFATLYLRGSSYNGVMYTRGETEYQNVTSVYNGGQSSDFTMGIHNRGCGMLMYDERESTYNYVDQINKMLTTYEGESALTREEIYDPANLAKVKVAVADLILDEMALETAFEGNRFFDLMRYARFRGQPDQFAKRVAKRGETEDANLRSFLQNTNNWYFKLPQH